MEFHLDFSTVYRAWPYLLEGLGTTFLLLAVSICAGLALGSLLAVGRVYGSKPVAAFCTSYINLFRAIPMILTLFWSYILMPGVLRWLFADPYLSVGPIYAALIALSLSEAAYFAEIMRAGIQSIRVGQRQAGLSLGFTQSQALRYVLLPQAFRNMSPALLSQFVTLLKDTSLVYVISLNDFLGAASRIGNRDGSTVEMYLFVAAVYLVLCTTGTKISNALQGRVSPVRRTVEG